MTDAEREKWIMAASLEDLLRKWRFSPAGDPFFQGAVGLKFRARMEFMRLHAKPGEWVETSKRVGWAWSG